MPNHTAAPQRKRPHSADTDETTANRSNVNRNRQPSVNSSSDNDEDAIVPVEIIDVLSQAELEKLERLAQRDTYLNDAFLGTEKALEMGQRRVLEVKEVQDSRYLTYKVHGKLAVKYTSLVNNYRSRFIFAVKDQAPKFMVSLGLVMDSEFMQNGRY
ncbi:unnamed protein product [Absidia cylindrospora]